MTLKLNKQYKDLSLFVFIIQYLGVAVSQLVEHAPPRFWLQVILDKSVCKMYKCKCEHFSANIDFSIS